MCGSTKSIARVLVQQQQQRQGAFRLRQPVLQLATGRQEVGAVESVAKQGIEGFILGKPVPGASLFPELDYRLRCYLLILPGRCHSLFLRLLAKPQL